MIKGTPVTEKYIPLAKSITRKLTNNDTQYDDCLGAAYEGLCVAARTHDNSLGVPFASWARTNITGKVLNFIRGETDNQDPLIPIESADDYTHLHQPDNYKQADDREFIGHLLGSLTDRQQEIVLYYYVLELTQAEIADVLGISQQTVAEHVANGYVSFRRQAHKMGVYPKNIYEVPC